MNTFQKLAVLMLVLLMTGFVFGCGDDDDDDDSGGMTPDDDDAVDDDDNIIPSDDDDTADDDDIIADDDDQVDDDDATSEGLPFFDAHTFFDNISSWSGEAGDNNSRPVYSLGEFGVGNGRAFALVGSVLPYTSLRNILGPDWERDPRYFSDKQFRVYAEGIEQHLVSQTIERVRKTAIVLTHSVYENDLVLHTVDFAPKGGAENDDLTERAMIRVMILENTSDQPMTRVSVQFLSVLGNFINGVHREVIEPKVLDVKPLGFEFPQGKATGRILYPDLPAGRSAQQSLVFAFVYDNENSADVFSAVETTGVDTLVDETQTWWEHWYDGVGKVVTPDEKFNDLLESLQVTIRTQVAHNGASCVMSEYTRTWIRDIYGPVMLYAPYGRNDDIKSILDYYYKAAVVRGSLANSMPVNEEIDNLPAEPDWENMGTMTGRTSAESVSYLALQYGEYYRQSGDLDTITERYPMLKHSVLKQNFTDGCLLPFSGDETFREVMSLHFGYLVGGTAYEDIWFSYNSQVLFIAAAKQLAYFAEKLNLPADVAEINNKIDEVTTCTEDYFWVEDDGIYAPMITQDTREPVAKPYEDVSFKGLWTGYGNEFDPHQIENFANSLAAIGHADGTCQSTIHPLYGWLPNAEDGFMTGMSHAYCLDALTRTEHPLAEKSFDIWKKHFSDSGNVWEVHNRKDYGRLTYLVEPFGLLSDLVSRYRPWEGGLQGRSLLDFLFGYTPNVPEDRATFRPHLPDGWDEISFEQAAFGAGTMDLTFSEISNVRTFVIDNDGPGFTADVKIAVPGEITKLRINNVGQNLSDYDLFDFWHARQRIDINDLEIPASQSVAVEVTYE